jgi:hypothetical protein
LCQCCPVAIDIETISSQFADILSYEEAHIEVITQERSYSKATDAQTGLRSLLGLIMATSACPRPIPVKRPRLEPLAFFQPGRNAFSNGRGLPD